MLPLGWWVVIGWFLFVIAVGLVFFAWAWRRGYFKDAEEPKYTMLEDKEPIGWEDVTKLKKLDKRGAK